MKKQPVDFGIFPIDGFEWLMAPSRPEWFRYEVMLDVIDAMTETITHLGFANPCFSLASYSTDSVRYGLIELHVSIPEATIFDLDFVSARLQSDIDYDEFLRTMPYYRYRNVLLNNTGFSVKVKNYDADELFSPEFNPEPRDVTFHIRNTPVAQVCRQFVATNIVLNLFATFNFPCMLTDHPVQHCDLLHIRARMSNEELEFALDTWQTLFNSLAVDWIKAQPSVDGDGIDILLHSPKDATVKLFR